MPDTTSGGGIRIPAALQKECLVRTREEDPEVLRERRATVKDRSVKDLAQIGSIGDIPVPATISNLLGKKKKKERSRWVFLTCPGLPLNQNKTTCY